MAEKTKEADEIEVTPEMVKAGFYAIRPLDADLFESLGDREATVLLSAIYRAMKSREGRAEPV